MKITTITIRTLIGLLMLFASISYFFALIKEPAQVGNMKVFNDGLKAAVYLMPMVKSIELLCGICFISGKFMKIAPIVLFPIVINIFCISLFLANEVLPIGVILLIGNSFLIYSNWASYSSLFKA